MADSVALSPGSQQPVWQVDRFVVSTALVGLALLGGLVWLETAPFMVALFAVGTVLGMALYHGAFGFTAGWRNLVVKKRGAGMRAQLLLFGVTSLIMVPMDTPGIERQKIHKIGMHSSDTAQIFFDDVRVPKRNLIGEEGAGFIYQMLQFQEERIYGAASSLKAFDRQIDLTIEYTKERKTFGTPLLDNQVIHFRLAELRTEVELLRSLVYRCVEDFNEGKDVTKLASMAKLKTGRLAREIADSCLQYWGGMGYTADNPLSRAFRDGRLISIGGGADEIMLGIIAKYEGTLPKRKKEAPAGNA
jgi:alkylation response protein AidB-like acyl-CoA dehydrogenase